MPDMNTKSRFDLDTGGSRISTSVGGSLLGLGGDVIICDDLHDTAGIESAADREAVLRFFQEVSSTRLNQAKEAAVVVVAQRLHEEDVCGWILSNSKEGEWEHLMCPMRFEFPALLCDVTVGRPEGMRRRDRRAVDVVPGQAVGEFRGCRNPGAARRRPPVA